MTCGPLSQNADNGAKQEQTQSHFDLMQGRCKGVLAQRANFCKSSTHAASAHQHWSVVPVSKFFLPIGVVLFLLVGIGRAESQAELVKQVRTANRAAVEAVHT